jgi:hypothetical protein
MDDKAKSKIVGNIIVGALISGGIGFLPALAAVIFGAMLGLAICKLL